VTEKIRANADFNEMTGGVVWILYFLDEVIRLGPTSTSGQIVEARDAGRAYLKDVLLPAWLENETWGRHYWDWGNPVQVPNVTAFVAKYMMDHKDEFPNWRNDCRNIMTVCLNRLGVSPQSNGDVYSGAWAEPESCGCCGQCLTAMPGLMADAWARYGVEADSDWAREIARRMTILTTYDFHETGVAEDKFDGGVVTVGEWFEAAHMAPARMSLAVLGWLPEVLGANRENHLVRSSSVVRNVRYAAGRIEYVTFDAPAEAIDVLRLAFVPQRITGGGQNLERRTDLSANGYTVKPLGNGDCMVSIRHDGRSDIAVQGDDPAHVKDDSELRYEGSWTTIRDAVDSSCVMHVAEAAGAAVSLSFSGNQVQVLGGVAQDGGLAEVYLDGVKQRVGIDCWNPLLARTGQVLYYTSALKTAAHELKIVATGKHNPRSIGTRVFIDSVQYSEATGDNGFGEGGGPVAAQRFIFGYPHRTPYVDSHGQSWWPAGEFIVRSGNMTDAVERSWWTVPTALNITNMSDPELYRYGVHAPEFWVNATVGPGTYRVVIKLLERRAEGDPKRAPLNIAINGQPLIQSLDITAEAGGPGKALDLTFEDIHPQNGTIELRFTSTPPGEAIVQAIEILPEKTSSAP
jgi:hypothetical protein